MQMLAMAVEYSHAEDEPLVDRCENWGRCYVDRMSRSAAGSTIGSLEKRYRNPTGWHWDYDAKYGRAPDVRPYLDHQDAAVINAGWQTIHDIYHQMILGGHYVRRWSPSLCSRKANEAAGREVARKVVSDHEFGAILGMAHGLLEKQLAIPAVIRRDRLTARVRTALELEVWA